MSSLLYFLKHIQIPLAPGWPFSPLLKFACLHETITATLLSIAEPKDALKYITKWNIWLVSTLELANASAKPPKSLPEGFTISRVPEDQIQTVIDTSSIPRQASTYLMLPNVGVLNKDGKLAAWGYIGIDGSLATLYVLPPYQRRGLATLVATELLKSLKEGGFKDLGYSGETGWVHADVYDGNAGSEAVMKSLGGKVWWESAYVHIDCEKF
jgi:ribosomal protein S18 acetylase RimI-like enzyme